MRKLKKEIYTILCKSDIHEIFSELDSFEAKKIVSPLLLYLYNNKEIVKWHAVKALGYITRMLAEQNIEEGRNIIRRLMWNLNDESGGIGWGSPEAMGEILANNEGLANEYALILISYINQDGNYQENETMQRGVLWGIGRVGQIYPDLVKSSYPLLSPFLKSKDASLRGHTIWILGMLRNVKSRKLLEELTHDSQEFRIFLNNQLITSAVKEQAHDALSKLDH